MSIQQTRLMKIKDYQVKPENIDSVPALIEFVSAIPDEAFCVDELQSLDGRRCVMGHIGAAYDDDPYSSRGYRFGPEGTAFKSLDAMELVRANNGTDADGNINVDYRMVGVKARVLSYLQSKLAPEHATV